MGHASGVFVMLLLAVVLACNGQQHNEMLNRAVALDPQNPLSHFSLGLMYEHQSDSGRALAEFHETQRLIDTLSLPASSPDIRNRIIKGTQGETWYHDQFGKDYLLDQILVPLKKKLSKQ